MSEPAWQSAYVLALAVSFALEIALLALVWRERDVRGAPGVAAALHRLILRRTLEKSYEARRQGQWEGRRGGGEEKDAGPGGSRTGE